LHMRQEHQSIRHTCRLRSTSILPHRDYSGHSAIYTGTSEPIHPRDVKLNINRV
jgi:hypothetical protein